MRVLCWGLVSMHQDRVGRRGHGRWQHPSGTLMHASARAGPHETCPCVASLHAVQPRALGIARLHAPWHVGTIGERRVCVGHVPKPRRRVYVVPCCASATRCVWMRMCQAWTSVCMSRQPRCSMLRSAGCHPPSCPPCGVLTGCPMPMSPVLPSLTLCPLSLLQAASSPATPSAKPR